MPTACALASCFADLPDPRVERTQRHRLVDILVIALCATLCGADDFVAIEQWGRAHATWLDERLALPNGIPAHDTFGRVFAALNPEAFSRCFLAWVGTLRKQLGVEVVAIDGKTLRRSHDHAGGRAAIHMVSAWATANRLVLGQVKVDDKSNEITAIPALLRLLDLNGSIVTLDAMGCQKAITRQIVAQGGDYLIAVKENQPTLYEDLRLFLADARTGMVQGVGEYREVDGGHGRVETRRCWSVADLGWLRERQPAWEKLTSIVLVERQRQVQGGPRTVEQHYYLSSLAGGTARTAAVAAHAARSHWGIENQVHWVLDVSFDEDRCRVRMGNAAQNLATTRHLALNALRQDATLKVGIKNKRLRAGWDKLYLQHLLTLI
jgi:predicted transposase YbfD/YdcC